MASATHTSGSPPKPDKLIATDQTIVPQTGQLTLRKTHKLPLIYRCLFYETVQKPGYYAANFFLWDENRPKWAQCFNRNDTRREMKSDPIE